MSRQQGKPRQGKARVGKTRHGKAKQHKATQGNTRTTKDNTRQHKDTKIWGMERKMKKCSRDSGEKVDVGNISGSLF